MAQQRKELKDLKERWGFKNSITVWGTVTPDVEGREKWWLNDVKSSIDGERLSAPDLEIWNQKRGYGFIDGILIDNSELVLPEFEKMKGKRVRAFLKLADKKDSANEELFFYAHKLRALPEPDWDERAAEEDHWQKEIDERKQIVDELDRKIADAEVDERNIRDRVAVLQAEADNLKEQNRTIETDLDLKIEERYLEIEEEESKLEQLRQKRALLGFEDKAEEVEASTDWKEYPLSVIAKKANAYIRSQNSIYKESLIKDFTACLATHDIIILAGGSGCGKSSLCRLFAEATGSEFRLIPVKPNWTSSDDLLGFYSSIEQRFIKTKFIQALIDAAKEPHKLFIVCLDEMNLARPEYYFADFLSYLEKRNGERKLALDVPKLQDVDREKVRNLLADGVRIDESTTTIDEWIADPVALECIKDRLHLRENEEVRKELCRLRHLVETEHEDISNEMKIPNNIRFVGTVNIDETTNFFSPKILDRVHVIRVENPILDEDFSFEVEMTEARPIKASAENFGQLSDYPPVNTKLKVCEQLIELSRRVFIPMNMDISVRVLRQSLNYAEQARKVGLTEKDIMDSILEHKVFPQCVFNRDDLGKENKKLDELKSLKQGSLSGIVGERTMRSVDRLIDQGERSDFINWWN